MADGFTTLNPGSGGSSMDEEDVTYGSAPTTRKRTRVRIGGLAAADLAPVQTTQQTGVEAGLIVRPTSDSVRDAGNEQSTPLGIGASFTGAFKRVGNVGSIVVSYITDQAPTYARLHWSVDGTTPDASPQGVTYVSVNFISAFGLYIGTAVIDPVLQPFYRLEVVNGAVAQTFAITTISLTNQPYAGTFIDLTSGLGQFAQALLTRSVVAGTQPDGGFVNEPANGISSANSSIANLAGAATFTGAFLNLDGFAGLGVSIITDQSGTLLIDNSEDGTTVDRTSSFPVTGGTPFFIGLTPLMRYVRIRYTNGATPTTTFRMQTFAKLTPFNPTQQRADGVISDASILQQGRQVIAGKYDTAPAAAPANTYKNVPVNLLGHLTVVSADFLRDVSLGRVAGHTVEHIMGVNDNLSSAVEEVWNPSSTTRTLPAAAAVASLVSTSVAGDIAAGTGARTVRIFGLDATYTPVQVLVTMNGIVPVVTTQTFIRIQKIQVETAGSGGSAAGTITCSVSGNLQAQIEPAETISYGSGFCVPAGKTGLITGGVFTTGNADEMIVRFQSSLAGTPFLTAHNFVLVQAALARDFTGGATKLASQTDLRWVGLRTAAGTGRVHLEYNVLLVDNGLVA